MQEILKLVQVEGSTQTKLILVSTLSPLVQVKELGLLGMDCECLAQDSQRLFDIYWYLSSPGAVIPSSWPSDYTALYNIEEPASISVNGSAPVDIYWAVSTHKHSHLTTCTQ